MDNGWNASAAAWIADMGEHGDFGRRRVLDAPMLARIEGRKFARAIDIGCGEGRFCRMLKARGIATVGIDPTGPLLERACAADPGGDYRIGVAEELPFDDATFDLAVSYLTLIDIPDYRRAIAEMARVLRPGGTVLVANLASHFTASAREGWLRRKIGRMLGYAMRDYSLEQARWTQWRGIRIVNWHRPFSAYFAAFLGEGLILRHFGEPLIPDPQTADDHRYNNAPWFETMEWQKPDQLR